MNSLKHLKLYISLCGLLLTLLPPEIVSAYSSPYYALRVNNFPLYSLQQSQIVTKNNITYIAVYGMCYVYKIVENTPYSVAGIPNQCGYSPDGSIAAQNTLATGPSSIDVADDGTVYIAEAYGHTIRAVSPSGTLYTVAGNGTAISPSLHQDADNAKQTPFSNPTYIKLGPDNSLYVYDTGVIRRVLPDGSTDHVVGAFGAYGNNNPYVDGGIATAHAFGRLQEAFHATYFWKSWCLFDFNSEGNLIASSGSDLYEINLSNGIIFRFYKPAPNPSYSLEEEPLASKNFGTYLGLDVDEYDNIWITNWNAIQYITPDNIVKTAAGGGSEYASAYNSIPGNQLRVTALMSISIENDKIYYLGSNTTDYYNGINAQVGLLTKDIINIEHDDSSPYIQAQSSPTANSKGWNNTSVALSWDVSDEESSITNSTGCNPTIVFESGVYTCTATSLGGTSSQSITLYVDYARPTLSMPIWSQNIKATVDRAVLTIPINDDSSGVASAEYFLGDTDPGQGNGATMQLTNIQNDGRSADATTTFGTDFPTGVYKVSVRAQDSAGNWSEPVSDYLVVYNPSGPKFTGKRTIVPSLNNGDELPGLITDGQTDKAKFGFSVKYNNQGQIASNSDFQLTYSTGTHCNNPKKADNCHDLSLNATSIEWLTTQGDNDSTGIFQGSATLDVDGQSSNVTFRVTGIDGERLSPTGTDQFQVVIYPEGADMNIDTPAYKINSGDIGRGNIKIK